MRSSRGKYYGGHCPSHKMPNTAPKGSIGAMVEQIDGLRGTKDLTEWEEKFVTSIMLKYYNNNKNTTGLSGKQVEIIERIWKKHFAG